MVRYLYQPGELEGGTKRATDPIWSLDVYNIERVFIKPKQPILYYLADGPKRGFVREELLVVPPNTQLPPRNKLTRYGIQLVLCVFHPAVPIFCHNTRSAPASPARTLPYSHPAFGIRGLLPCLCLLSSADLKRCQLISFCRFDIPFELVSSSLRFCL